MVMSSLSTLWEEAFFQNVASFPCHEKWINWVWYPDVTRFSTNKYLLVISNPRDLDARAFLYLFVYLYICFSPLDKTNKIKLLKTAVSRGFPHISLIALFLYCFNFKKIFIRAIKFDCFNKYEDFNFLYKFQLIERNYN